MRESRLPNIISEGSDIVNQNVVNNRSSNVNVQKSINDYFLYFCSVN